jgi:hypothetical protein
MWNAFVKNYPPSQWNAKRKLSCQKKKKNLKKLLKFWLFAGTYYKKSVDSLKFWFLGISGYWILFYF